MARSPKYLSVVLDAEYAEKLRVLAGRLQVSPGALARALLSSALDEASFPSPHKASALLDGIDGAFAKAQAGLEDAVNGRVVTLDEL